MKRLLTTLLLVFPILISANSSKYDTGYKIWSELTKLEKNQILMDARIPKNIKKFYDTILESGIVNVTDDKETEEMLIKFSSINVSDKRFPLYFYLFNEIVRSSDGALAEILVEYCFEMIKNKTLYVLRIIGRDKKLYRYYVDFCGSYLYFNKDVPISDLKDVFKAIPVQKIQKDLINRFVDDVQKFIDRNKKDDERQLSAPKPPKKKKSVSECLPPLICD